jgi:hypothetical protein
MPKGQYKRKGTARGKKRTGTRKNKAGTARALASSRTGSKKTTRGKTGARKSAIRRKK